MSDHRLAAFETLVSDFSVCNGLVKEALRREALGVVTYSLVADNAEAAFAYLPGPGQSHFNVLIDAGPAPALTRAEQWRALMELNFSMVSSRHDACFCCDGAMKRLQLRMVFRLGDVDAKQVGGSISEGVKAVRRWEAFSNDAVMQP